MDEWIDGWIRRFMDGWIGAGNILIQYFSKLSSSESAWCVCVSLSRRFALGDARRPLQETAALVEDIVHTQLITMVTVLSCVNVEGYVASSSGEIDVFRVRARTVEFCSPPVDCT